MSLRHVTVIAFFSSAICAAWWTSRASSDPSPHPLVPLRSAATAATTGDNRVPLAIAIAPEREEPEHHCDAAIPANTETEAWITIDESEDADRMRMASINAALSKANRPPIETPARIRAEDVDAFRAIVDSAEKGVSDAEDKWLSIASSLTSSLESDLLTRIKRGEQHGLPLLSEDNQFRRTHPHEAISQVSHNGRLYVLRANPRNHPNLGKQGLVYEQEVFNRSQSYDQLIRPMLSPLPPKK